MISTHTTYVFSGTGKTRTLVGAILEIIRTSDHCVLITANSNSACDEITERLIQNLNSGEIFRLYAKSFNAAKVSPRILPICNLRSNVFKMPSLKYIYKFRVVVCTLLTSGCLVRARDMDSEFRSDHFSDIFIDEAACAQVPVLMVAIAGNTFLD